MIALETSLRSVSNYTTVGMSTLDYSRPLLLKYHDVVLTLQLMLGLIGGVIPIFIEILNRKIIVKVITIAFLTLDNMTLSAIDLLTKTMGTSLMTDVST